MSQSTAFAFLLVLPVVCALQIANSTAVAQDEIVMQIVRTPGAQPSTVRIKMHPEWAPIGAAHFQQLAGAHFFDNAAFFRVVPNFIVQFGLPANPQPEATPLQDDPVKVSNKRGYLVYATAGPNTRTSQLFVNLKDNAGLDSQGFAPFAEVVEGMDAIDGCNPEYGENPDQGSITSQGNAYLDQEFPNLTKIKSMTMR